MPPVSTTISERIIRIEEQTKAILDRLNSMPTPERCAIEEGRVSAIENDIKTNIKPQIADIYGKVWWALTAALVAAGSLITGVILVIVRN